MTDSATLERIVRLEEHLKSQDGKLDHIIQLTEAQDVKIEVLTTDMGVVSQKVDTMAPTVKIGENVITTAKTMNSVARWAAWTSPIIVAFFYWMADRWHLIGQLFKRAG